MERWKIIGKIKISKCLEFLGQKIEMTLNGFIAKLISLSRIVAILQPSK
jgi:hypothetical protein